MTPRTLTIVLAVGLAVSVAVNLFAATAAYVAVTGQSRIEHRMEHQARPERRPSARELIRTLDPQTQGAVRQALRQAGLAARPDFQEAREARRQAVASAAGETFDPAAVEALLARSRAAEARGRAKLEAETVAVLATLNAEDRRAFAAVLDSRGRGGGRGQGPSRAEKGN